MVQDAVTVSSHGASHLVFFDRSDLTVGHLSSILRAFLVEEAKIVKKVIKSQQKTARK